MSNAEQFHLVAFTIVTALAATALLSGPAIALALLLARRRFTGKTLLETLVTLPLVMPPVATGLLLLRLFGHRTALGRALEVMGLGVVFSWRGVVLAMMVMASPLLIRNARVAFEQVDRRLEDVARSLGASERHVFFAVTLPLAGRGIISGLVLAFARSVGEFGATVIVAGDIPGRTTTLSVAIYDSVQLANDNDAFRLLAVAVLIAFVAVWTSEVVFRNRPA